MMKEYMCSSFLASQILHEAITPVTKSTQRLQRKFGIAGYEQRTPKATDLLNNMRYDEGSKEYKNWLAKCVQYCVFVLSENQSAFSHI